MIVLDKKFSNIFNFISALELDYLLILLIILSFHFDMYHFIILIKLQYPHQVELIIIYWQMVAENIGQKLQKKKKIPKPLSTFLKSISYT